MSETKTRRELDLDALMLKKGNHRRPSEGMCVMEAAAYVAGRPHTDRPPCVSPVIGAFLWRWNDDLVSADERMIACGTEEASS